MSKKENEGAEPAPSAPASPEAAAPDYYDQLLRLKAEFENYRKRTDRDRPQLVQAGKAELLLKLLPVYDVLLKAHKDMQAHPSADQLSQGMEMVFKEFQKIFTAEGVKEIESEGKLYDPHLHEVIGTEIKKDHDPDTVIQEVQKGFMLNGKVLRPAKVRISKKVEGNNANE